MTPASWLILAAAVFVPRVSRDDWRSEWQAELIAIAALLEQRGVPRLLTILELLRFAAGSVCDALWHCRESFDLDAAYRRAESPGFCLAALLTLNIAIAVASGGLPATRAAILPLPYEHANQIATLAQGGVASSFRSTVRRAWLRAWTTSLTVDEFATYQWEKNSSEARVSSNFFTLLGAHVEKGDPQLCADCALITTDFAELHGLHTLGQRIQLQDRSYKLAGILEPGFWFLSRRIAVWTPDPGTSKYTGVVARLAADSTRAAVQNELVTKLQKAGVPDWNLIDVTPVDERVHSVLFSFAFAALMASIITAAAIGFPVLSQSPGLALFFAAKTALGLLAVLFAGIEFTRASSITMTGGTDLLTEPLSTWLFLLASMGVLTWSLLDQRRRCRVCVRRLGLAARVGCPGCLLLDWAGTELVCKEGHGMLHVPEMTSSWNEPARWTALDESWLTLFAPKT